MIQSATRGSLALVLLALIVHPAASSGRVPAPLAAPALGGTGAVMILTDPPGTRVWIGDRYVGTTPARAESLAPGRQQLILASGATGQRWRRPLLVFADVRAGGLDTLRIDLRGARDPLPRLDPPMRVRAEIKTGRSPVPRLGTALPIAALGLGAAGAWLQHSADQAYRDYLHTVDRDRMESRYRRAQRLDRASVVTWIGAEVCLAGAAWIWLRGDRGAPIAVSVDPEGGVRLAVRVSGAVPAPAAGGGEP